MNYRRLGRSNYMVSVIGFGTAQLRRVPEKQAVETLKRAFQLGINLVNTAPDYEGAEDLVARAIRDSDLAKKVFVSIQAGGDTANFERVFEASCRKFDTDRLDLFGISAISDHEAFGFNVWGEGGVVDFLLRKKEEGRIGALFGSDHGSPEHLKALLERDIFDVLMLAYNPLGFHVSTYRAETVWEVLPPAIPLQKKYELEDIPRTGREILPLAQERDIGIVVMKPLAGGLLCAGKAFPSLDDARKGQTGLSTTEAMRYILMHPAIASVVPGTASLEEVEENAAAGVGNLVLNKAQVEDIEDRVSRLSLSLCSRCGHCDDLCSKQIPLSFVFRAAYLYLYPSVPFEASAGLRYFDLHPWKECICKNCRERSCFCPKGIDIPNELQRIHRKMRKLLKDGFVPSPDKGHEDWATGRTYDFKVLSRDIPGSLPTGGQAVVRLHLRNTGSKVWHCIQNQDHSYVALRVLMDGQPIQTVCLRQDVHPTGDGHFAFALKAPKAPGKHQMIMDLFEHEGPSFRAEGADLIQATIEVSP